MRLTPAQARATPLVPPEIVAEEWRRTGKMPDIGEIVNEFLAEHKRTCPYSPPSSEWTPGFGAACPDLDTRSALDFWTYAMPAPRFVYFVQADDGGPVKIGQTVEPWKRLRELQIANSNMLVLRSVVAADGQLERDLHEFWNRALVRGEWYGNGYENAILACARKACTEQQLHYEWGEPLRSVIARTFESWFLLVPEVTR